MKQEIRLTVVCKAIESPRWKQEKSYSGEGFLAYFTLDRDNKVIS
jgi:hypothetical protein